MKVALICDWYAPRIGGLEMQMRDLARNLRSRGHEPHVITATRATQNGNPDTDASESFPIHRLDVPLFGPTKTIRSRAALGPLSQVLERERFDVLHCHTALSPLAQGGAYLGRQLGIPSVLTEHSVLKGAGHLVLKSINQVIPWASWPDIVTGVSSYLKRELEAATGRTDIEVLPNGVDPGEWLPADPGRDEEVRIVSTMRFTKRKAPVEIVRLIPEVVAKVTRPERLKFCIIGGGPEEERVRAEVKRLGVERWVELPGWQPRATVKEWLARSSVFILPTSKEALSIASLEALSTGLPVIAYDHGGVGDIVTDGEQGFLVSDRAAFIDRIARLANDPDLRRRMSAASRLHIGRFSWDTIIARHIACYEAAIVRRFGYTHRTEAQG